MKIEAIELDFLCSVRVCAQSGLRRAELYKDKLKTVYIKLADIYYPVTAKRDDLETLYLVSLTKTIRVFKIWNEDIGVVLEHFKKT